MNNPKAKLDIKNLIVKGSLSGTINSHFIAIKNINITINDKQTLNPFIISTGKSLKIENLRINTGSKYSPNFVIGNVVQADIKNASIIFDNPFFSYDTRTVAYFEFKNLSRVFLENLFVKSPDKALISAINSEINILNSIFKETRVSKNIMGGDQSV